MSSREPLPETAHRVRPVLVVIGTRPEAIKLAPVVEALRRNGKLAVKTCLTGQHRELLTQGLSAFDLTIDHQLDVMTTDQHPAQLIARIMAALTPVVLAEPPAWIVVQGDTTSALAAALVGFQCHIPVAHVEAGLRSGDRLSPWPEEMNRRLVGQLADLHFAPTPGAEANLLAEQIPAHQIIVTGNTVIDALHLARRRIAAAPDLAAAAGEIIEAAAGRALILVTVHRRENIDHALPAIAAALTALADPAERLIVLPLHPNPRLKALRDALAGHPGILLAQPFDYLPFVALLDAASMILTDSGGIQEEAAALGKPVLVLREKTERPELVTGGNGLVVGTETATIIAAARPLLADAAARARLARPHETFGDGMAAERIAATLESRTI